MPGLVTEAENLAHELGPSPTLLDNDAQVVLHRLGEISAFLHELGIAYNYSQQVVEIVGNTRCQSAHCD